MKNILLSSIILLLSVLVSSCSTETKTAEVEVHFQCPMKCEGGKTYSGAGSCPVCKMDLKQIHNHNKMELADAGIAPESIFNLTSKWTTQNNEIIELKDLKGDILVMVMIYTSCQAACPRLVADVRNIDQKVNDPTIRYVFVSIDPETDTPERLKEFAIENQMDTDQWVFLRGELDDVREFSNVLSVKYKKISPMDFSHSNIISVFDKGGVLSHQQEGLGVNNEATVSKIVALSD
ncbi:MAG: SCO family protein [Cyclobacteriaceae bacterium]